MEVLSRSGSRAPGGLLELKTGSRREVQKLGQLLLSDKQF